MTTVRFLLFAFLLSASAVGQSRSLEPWLEQEPAPVPDGAPASMREIDRGDLARHAFRLASDEFGGRHTGTPGQVATAEYIAERFAALGLEPLGDEVEGERGFLQSYPVASTFLEPDGLGIEFGGVRHRTGFGVMPGKDGADAIDIDGNFVFCGTIRGREFPDEFEDGAIPVLVMPPGPERGRALPSEMQFMMGFRHIKAAAGVSNRAMRRGAKTVFILDLGGRLADVVQYGGLLPGKPMLRYGDELGMEVMLGGDNRAPFVVVGRPLAEELLEYLGQSFDAETGECRSTADAETAGKCTFRVRSTADLACWNVVACVRGGDPELRHEAIVFSAHMDHMGTRLDGEVFNGADDNASGSAALLEVAAAFASGDRPRRSVIFLSVSGEELGLWGSDWFAEHPTWDREKIVANVNIDMIGRSTDLAGPDQISATPSPGHSMFSTIVRDAARLGRALGLELTNGDTYYERSDHYNFAKHGIPVVFFCDGEHPDYHQVTDTPDKLDYAKMERVARLAFWTGWNVCQIDGRPERLGRRPTWLDEGGAEGDPDSR